MQVGYARVSTADQHVEGQVEQLRAAGADRVYVERGSGSNDERPELAACLAGLQAGDTLVVVALDRLGRSTSHLVRTVDELRARGVDLRSLRESLDTSSPAGQLVYRIFAAVAEFERDRLIERTQAGLHRARAAGRVGGRPSVMTPQRMVLALQMYDQGVSARQIAGVLGVSNATVTRHLAKALAQPGPASVLEPLSTAHPAGPIDANPGLCSNRALHD